MPVHAELSACATAQNDTCAARTLTSTAPFLPNRPRPALPPTLPGGGALSTAPPGPAPARRRPWTRTRLFLRCMRILPTLPGRPPSPSRSRRAPLCTFRPGASVTYVGENSQRCRSVHGETAGAAVTAVSPGCRRPRQRRDLRNTAVTSPLPLLARSEGLREVA